MSFAIVRSRSLNGLVSTEVMVEVHLANGLPSFSLVGLVETEVREARERVRAALQNSRLEFPHNKRITVNLGPADLPKESGRFDLAIALGILAASEQVPAERLDGYEFAGELSLAGDLRPVRGAIAMALALRRGGGAPRALVLPAGSAGEAARVGGLTVYSATHLLDVVHSLLEEGSEKHRPLAVAEPGEEEVAEPLPDLRDVKGHFVVKRALELAAAGGHSMLLVGPPGSGKSMLAQRLPSLLPPLEHDEALESAALLSLAGLFRPQQFRQRVFRTPHHSASAPALVGGGSPPRPGEISLAHHGVLFLDEFPEYPRSALEALREPLETGKIVISRAARTAEYPARFQLVAAMNPCPCGHYGSATIECRCTPDAIVRYQGRLSGPLLDRIDLQVDVPVVAPDTLAALPSGESSAIVAERVASARKLSLARQGCTNHLLAGDALNTHAVPEPAALKLLQAAAERFGWSARGYHRVLRVARTACDLAAVRAGATEPDGAPLTKQAVGEAIQYRRALGIG